MVPQRLEDWTLEKIRELLTNRYMEQETFDYKETLPHSKDDNGKKRLRKECCGFANSSGGFLVFGVHDDTARSVDGRLVGFDPHFDFPVHFGNYPSECTPSVRWEPRNPAIRLPGGNVIHVVWFPRSWSAPHALGEPEQGFVFPKRTNRGIEHMTYEEARMTFLGYYERRTKLLLLYSELLNVKTDANNMILPEDQRNANISLVTLQMNTIESVLVDTFIIIMESIPLVTTLTSVRNRARVINNRAAMIQPIAYSPLTNKNALLLEHNKWIQSECTILGSDIDTAMEMLKSIVSGA